MKASENGLLFNNKLLKIAACTFIATGGVNISLHATSSSFSQESGIIQQNTISITGRIVDRNGDPIIGVNVLEKGTTNGSITDMDGKFSLTVRQGGVLVLSYIGYKTQEIPIANKRVIEIVMEEDSEMVDEVIVVGYGTQKKATVTGSISQLGGEELKKSASVNLSNSLAGKTAGVIANSRSGEPGEDGATIMIRGKGTFGNTDPLVVIDGVADRSFSRLNPEDIESISVLKDASAAIYGSRAANGVILVKTKRGKEGKLSFNYNGDFAISQPTRVPEMLNSYQFATWLNEFDARMGNSIQYTPDIMEKIKGGLDPVLYPDTDWWDAVTKNWAPKTQHSISVNGGTEKLSFYVSAQYLYQDVIYKDSPQDYNQYQFISNLDAQLSKYVKFSFDILGRQEIRNRGVWKTEDFFGGFLRKSPISAPYYPNGLLQSGESADGNPLVQISDIPGTDKNTANSLNLKPYLKIDLSKVTSGLFVDGYAALDFTFNNGKTFRHPYDIYLYNPQTDEYENRKEATGVINLWQWSNNSKRITLNARIGYNKTIAENHNIDAFVAYEQSKYDYSTMDAYRTNYLSTTIPELFAGSSEPKDKDNDGSSTVSARQNYFGRINYDYKHKYLLELTARYDGSFNFASGKRWGFFPGVSAGWVLSEEKFWEGLQPIVNFLKIKGSWGMMGNDNIDAYQFLSQYKFGKGLVFGEEAAVNKSMYLARTANPNVTWETAKTFNLGFSSQFLNNKLGFDFDVFKSKRNDILITRSASIPKYTGLKLPSENIGKVNNSGVEFIATYADSYNDFKWNVNANFTYAKNRVVYMDEAATVPEWQKTEGHPVDGYLVYEAMGIYQTQEEIDNSIHLPGTKPGDLIYRDLNDDGKITSEDAFRSDLINTPEIIYGFTLGGDWKGIDLNIFLQGQARAKQIVMPTQTNLPLEFFEGRWSESNTAEQNAAAIYPRAMIKNIYGDNFNDRWSTWWLKDAGFLRLKSVEIGYTLPRPWLSKVGINKVRVYANGNNLFTFDKIKIADPEAPNNSGGVKFYPPLRTLTFGLNVTF